MLKFLILATVVASVNATAAISDITITPNADVVSALSPTKNIVIGFKVNADTQTVKLVLSDTHYTFPETAANPAVNYGCEGSGALTTCAAATQGLTVTVDKANKVIILSKAAALGAYAAISLGEGTLVKTGCEKGFITESKSCQETDATFSGGTCNVPVDVGSNALTNVTNEGTMASSGPCKACDTFAGEKLKAGTCFCGDAKMAATKGAICTSSTTTEQKCTISKGDRSAKEITDEYTCENFSTESSGSGSHGVVTSVAALLTFLLARRLC